MKKYLFLLLMPVLFPAMAMSAENIYDNTRRLTTGVELYSETYAERSDEGERLMQEDATMASFYLHHYFPVQERAGLSYLLRLSGGRAVYTGSNDGETFGSVKTKGYSRFAADIRGMGHFLIGQNLWIGAGLGLRLLQDNLQDGDPDGIKRISQYIYLPMSVGGTFQVSSLYFTPELTFNYLLAGLQRSWMVEFTKHKQRSGYGVELALPVAFKEDSLGWVKITPFYRHWNIATSEPVDSEVMGPTVEPANKTHEVGLRATIEF